MRKSLACTMLLGCLGSLNAQVNLPAAGTGATPFALAQDYRALQWNPAGLAFHCFDRNIRTTAGGFEGGISVRSTMFDRADLWDDLLNRPGSEENWTDLTSSDWIDRIQGQTIELDASAIVAGSYRQVGNWGFAYVHRQSFQAEMKLGEQTASLLFEGGASSLFDFVVLATGDTLANDGSWNLENITQVAQGFGGGALLANVLGDSRLGFSYTKSHEIGMAKSWGKRDDGWQLHTGVGARLILGNGYFSVSADENGELDAFGAFSRGFSVPTLDTVAASILNPTFDRLRNWGPVGQGWGVDIGATISMADQLWISAALNNIGFVEWRGESYFTESVAIESWTATPNSPNNWIDAATEALDPMTWFDQGTTETRQVALPLTLNLGGGLRMGKGLILAADAAFANPENLDSEGMRGGISAVMRLMPWLRIDGGIRKLQNERLRIPIGLVLENPKGGIQVGVQLSDAQGLWRPSSPEIGMNFCFLRWVWMRE